ncbi:NAD(P)/FAD-dependent oxidoreductase [Nocardiopsis alba]|uniref:NAD(P)/FAD-dependent oxidoreductase n=1 Tax=Nocardiopsis alba TaxID=53437 RepID=UPI00366CA895
MRTVIVVGAGVIGASVALHTALNGMRTLVLDGGAEPCTGASAASFSRATAFGKEPEPYFELNHAGLEELHGLHAQGAPGFHPCPGLVWAADPDRTAAQVETARARGYAAAHVSARRVPVPGVEPADPPESVAHLPEEGWVDLPRLSAWSLDRARSRGARILLSCPVARLLTDDGSVTGVELADGRRLSADVVVNAAGPGAEKIAADVGGPLSLAPTLGLLADLPLPGGLGAMVLAPGVSIRPHGPESVRVRSEQVDGRLGASAPTGHEHDRLLAELIERAAAVVPALSGARALSTRVGVRAFPSDGRSSVGTLSGVPGYYEVVTHSGATVGPLLGRLAAEEIDTGRRPPMLAPYAPDRFRIPQRAEQPATTAHQ